MTLKKQLRDDLKSAMREKDEVRKRTLRMALAEIKNREIELQKELDQADIADILHKEVKRRRETLEELTQVSRPELAASERAELEVLMAYMPKQLSRQEIADLADQVIAEMGATSPRQMGQVMGALMPQLKGQADGKLVGQVVRELLNR
jgi:uncharacterized protein